MKSSVNLSKKVLGGLFAAVFGLLSLNTVHAQQLYAATLYDGETSDVNSYNSDGTAGSLTPFSNSGLDTAIAVSGSDLFVLNQTFVGNQVTGTLSEYTTSGSLVNSSLITGLGNATGLAINGSDLYVSNASSGTISEYTLGSSPGTIASSDTSFITGLNEPGAIAISGSNLFVTESDFTGSSGTVGEYSLSGSGTSNASFITGLTRPTAIAVSGSDIFVANGVPTNGNQESFTSVGEYTTSGSTVNANLISGLRNPWGLAVLGSNIYVASFGYDQNGATALGGIGEYSTAGITENQVLVGVNSGNNEIYAIAATGGAAAPSPVTETTQSSLNVTPGTTYSSIAPVTASGGFGSTASIAGGTASSSGTVNVTFSPTTAKSSFANIASDIVTVSGMASKGTTPAGATQTDQFVLELTFDLNAANQIGGANALAIMWFNPAGNNGLGAWENAVAGNSDNGAGLTFVLGAYNPTLDDHLSYYGVDVADGYAWAVLDHNSTFGVGNPLDAPILATPEPSTWAMLVGGLGMLAFWRKRARKTAIG